MLAIYALWLRELKRYLRSKSQIISSLGQPVLYLLAMGFGLSPVYQKAGGGSYLQFIAPGVMGMMVMFSATLSGMAVLWDRQFGFLKETLVAPVLRLHVTIGRTIGVATVALIQGLLVVLVCFAAGFRPTSIAMLPAGLLFLALIAILFAALGLAIGSTLKDAQGFQMVMNFLVLPMFLFSGAMFPLSNLPTALTILTRIDPMSYGVDGLRAALIGQTHFGIVTDALVAASVGLVLTGIAAWRFSRIEI
jgi:ABC-2 type transport system permease protein